LKHVGQGLRRRALYVDPSGELDPECPVRSLIDRFLGVEAQEYVDGLRKDIADIAQVSGSVGDFQEFIDPLDDLLR
jgi:hypothetical protein